MACILTYQCINFISFKISSNTFLILGVGAKNTLCQKTCFCYAHVCSARVFGQLTHTPSGGHCTHLWRAGKRPASRARGVVLSQLGRRVRMRRRDDSSTGTKGMRNVGRALSSCSNSGTAPAARISAWRSASQPPFFFVTPNLGLSARSARHRCSDCQHRWHCSCRYVRSATVVTAVTASC